MKRITRTAVTLALATLGWTAAIAGTPAHGSAAGRFDQTGGTSSVTIGSCTAYYDWGVDFGGLSDKQDGWALWDNNCSPPVEMQVRIECNIGGVPFDDYTVDSGIVEGTGIKDQASCTHPLFDSVIELLIHFRCDDTCTWGPWQNLWTNGDID